MAGREATRGIDQELLLRARTIRDGRPAGHQQKLRTHHQKTVEELTRRQQEILLLIADGRSNKEISLQLEISTETVKSHVKSLLGALEARNRAQAIAIGYQHGLLGQSPDD